ncbi:class I histocompatibility antigen, F10 alpha chain-like [Dromaius novaehollandiae]|uniref:class I histocompatibility antigen, F10 alpha chain-like n=1 Tax=Dromaius novaehollandiae TaxID=8790 RepID=UPI00311DDEB8
MATERLEAAAGPGAGELPPLPPYAAWAPAELQATLADIDAPAQGPHSLRYFNTAVTKPSPGLPALVSVGYVDGELIDRYDSETQHWKHYLENSCIEGLRRYVEHGRAALVRAERPMVRVSAKESHGFVTLSCRAHGFYPRPISISWLKKGRVQAQETKRGSVTPNGDGTYHAWASIEGLPAEKHEYQCCMEHASLPEPGLFSWEPPSSLLPIVLGAVIAVVVVIVVWKSRWGRKEQGYVIAKGSNAAI